MTSGKLTKAIAIAAAVIVFAAAGFAVRRYVEISSLRAELGGRITETAGYIERGSLDRALIAAQQARELSVRVRDKDAEELAGAYLNIINTVIRADTHYYEGSYQSAKSAYRTALLYASDVDGIGTGYIDDMLVSTERYIEFNSLMQRAGSFADAEDFDRALALYNEAAQTASAIPFPDGFNRAMDGARLMEEQIAYLKWLAEMRLTAENYIAQGDSLLFTGEYDSAIVKYQSAADIYQEIEDSEGVENAASKIANAGERQAEAMAEKESALSGLPGGGYAMQGGANGTGGGETGENGTDRGEEVDYEYNRSLQFDLSTIIDRQDTGPASLVRMGATDDKNEGWYNGCGWIATYNALVRLGDPRHPADIVRYFETSGGTVMDGEFGTYPHAIKDYLSYLGHDARHTLIPRTRLSIDNEIKASGIGIIAYLHTSAAHYAMIEYRGGDGKFVVYNDSFARAYSKSAGLSESPQAGSVIDSVEAWLSQTPDILLTFSLITVTAGWVHNG